MWLLLLFLFCRFSEWIWDGSAVSNDAPRLDKNNMQMNPSLAPELSSSELIKRDDEDEYKPTDTYK